MSLIVDYSVWSVWALILLRKFVCPMTLIKTLSATRMHVFAWTRNVMQSTVFLWSYSYSSVLCNGPLRHHLAHFSSDNFIGCPLVISLSGRWSIWNTVHTRPHANLLSAHPTHPDMPSPFCSLHSHSQLTKFTTPQIPHSHLPSCSLQQLQQTAPTLARSNMVVLNLCTSRWRLIWFYRFWLTSTC